MEDVTKVTRERMNIEHERDYDTLTGLYNRRAFQWESEALFREHPEKLKTAAFVMIDMDNLKYTNDNFGHDFGDRYIHEAGRDLRNMYRKELCVPGFPAMNLIFFSMVMTVRKKSEM